MTEQWMTAQLSFNWAEASGYMRQMLVLDHEREEVNARITDARRCAQAAGVPTKAVEAALRAARGRRKCGLGVDEFSELLQGAERLLQAYEESPPDSRGVPDLVAHAAGEPC